MKLFQDMSLKWKLMPSLAIPVVLTIGLSTAIHFSTDSLIDSSQWVNHTHEAVNIGTSLGGAMIDMETGLRGYVIAGKEEFLEPYVMGQQNFEEVVSKGLNHVSDNPPQVQRLQKISTLKDEWLSEHANKSIQMRREVAAGSTTVEDVSNFIQEGHGKKRMDEIRSILQAFIGEEQALINVRSEEATAVAERSSNIGFYGASIGAALAVVMVFFITLIVNKSIVGPIARAGEIAKSIEYGHLDNDIDVQSNDEVGKLFLSLKGMQDKLRDLVAEISTSADSVLRSSSEISIGNTSLSERTDKQASSLEETAASMEEMTAAVKVSAEHADEANKLAAGARKQAERGSSVVSKAVTAMEEINQSSNKIADIIAVIDEIAFQTNLLALNAAVEAARAGEQGRGFAVVATEVRNLAQRSATSAKEIKDLIQDSVSKVEEGSKLVFESGQTLDEILGSVAKVSDVVAEITLSSQEQRSGIEQVNNAVVYIDDMTQKNSAMVDEAAKNSEAMTTHARSLNEQVSYFTTHDKRRA